MEVSVTNQAYIFLSSILGGLVVGFVYDIFRIWRKIFKTSNFITYLQDLLFWVLVALIIFTLVFITNSGELRWYQFLGVILGVVFYNLLLSQYVIKVSVTVLNFIKRIFLFIFNIFFYPFKLTYKILKKPFKILLKSLKAIFRKTKLCTSIQMGRVKKSIANVRNILKKT